MKATKKNNKKSVKVEFKPVFTVDLTNCETEEDALLEMIYSKHEAGLDLTSREVDVIVNDTIESVTDSVIDALFDGHNAVVIENGEPVPFTAVKIEVKKKPWYKRFWNWITGK